MNTRNKPKASSEAKRNRIIAIARKLFVTNGFANTSMQEIAKHCKVPKSLLFHHFTNKQTLWLQVKQNIVATVINTTIKFDTKHGLAGFITQIVTLRSKIYYDNPDLARLMIWQQLDNEHDQLIGQTCISPDKWLLPIKQLQQQGDMRSDMQATDILMFIARSSGFACSKKTTTHLIDCLIKALTP